MEGPVRWMQRACRDRETQKSIWRTHLVNGAPIAPLVAHESQRLVVVLPQAVGGKRKDHGVSEAQSKLFTQAGWLYVRTVAVLPCCIANSVQRSSATLSHTA